MDSMEGVIERAVSAMFDKPGETTCEEFSAGLAQALRSAGYVHRDSVVSVKALEWKKRSDGNGLYEGAWAIGHMWSVRNSPEGWVAFRFTDGEFLGAYTSETEAKAACQADYDRRILSALDIAEPGGWRPIESAPKDGTRFLAWFPAQTAGSSDFIAHQSVAWSAPNGVIWTVERIYVVEREHPSPTHWRPLPATPEEK